MFKIRDGFTLLELLVVVATLAILVALLLPGFSMAKTRAQRATCMNHLHQINVGLHLYASDSDDLLPRAETNRPAFTAFTRLVKSYVGVTTSMAQPASVFACPADVFYYDIETMSRASRISKPLHDQPESDYSSYAFNGGNFPYGPAHVAQWPGIAGRRVASVKDPAKTLLVFEIPALYPYSWHEPASGAGHYNQARCVLSFVDGHVSYARMYWDAVNAKGTHLEAWQYDPPAEYAYKWNPD